MQQYKPTTYGTLLPMHLSDWISEHRLLPGCCKVKEARTSIASEIKTADVIRQDMLVTTE